MNSASPSAASQSDDESADKRSTPGEERSLPALVESLYASHFKALVQFLAATFGQGPPPPEDTAQQAFEHLIRNNGLARARNPKALLWHAARNLAISARKGELARAKRERDYDYFLDKGDHISPERVIRAEAECSAVLEVIRAMPKQRQEAFVLVRIDGLTHTDAADRLGISRSAVSKYVARAAAQLAEAMPDD